MEAKAVRHTKIRWDGVKENMKSSGLSERMHTSGTTEFKTDLFHFWQLANPDLSRKWPLNVCVHKFILQSDHIQQKII